MSDLTPAMDVALGTPGVTMFVAGQMDLPGYTLRMLDAGEVNWDGNLFVSKDPTYGSIDSIDAITDGLGDQAPQLAVTIIPPGETASAALSNPDMQGSRIRIWLGAIVSGAVVVSPYLLFDGMMDQPALIVDKGKRNVTYECVSQFEYLFRTEEAARLSGVNQKMFYADDTFLDDVTGIVKNFMWGPGEAISGSPVGYGYSDGYGGGGRSRIENNERML